MAINRVDAAAKMYGAGSRQHKAAMKRWGKGGGPTAQVLNPKGKGKGSGGGRGQHRDSIGRFA